MPGWGGGDRSRYRFHRSKSDAEAPRWGVRATLTVASPAGKWPTGAGSVISAISALSRRTAWGEGRSSLPWVVAGRGSGLALKTDGGLVGQQVGGADGVFGDAAGEVAEVLAVAAGVAAQ